MQTEEIDAPATDQVSLAKYSPLRADIDRLKALNSSLVFLYTDKAGEKNARSHIQKMRVKKADVERARVELKSGALDFGRKVDATAKELAGELETMIQMHQKPLDEIAAKVQAEHIAAEQKAAAEKADADRVEHEKYEAQLAAERAESARVQAELSEMKRKAHEDQIRRDGAEAERMKAEVKAKFDAESLIKAEREKAEAIANALADQARKYAEAKRLEEERKAAAAAVEAKRMKNAKVRKELIEKISESIGGVLLGISDNDAAILAEGIIDGKIYRTALVAV